MERCTGLYEAELRRKKLSPCGGGGRLTLHAEQKGDGKSGILNQLGREGLDPGEREDKKVSVEAIVTTSLAFYCVGDREG